MNNTYVHVPLRTCKWLDFHEHNTFDLFDCVHELLATRGALSLYVSIYTHVGSG